MFTRYDKFLVGVLGIILTGLNISYGSNADVQIIISLATALGVYQVPNK